eukprot:Skav205854  [mRNA]  locus=scaffold766:67193:70827:+ [translate_table: standard]
MSRQVQRPVQRPAELFCSLERPWRDPGETALSGLEAEAEGSEGREVAIAAAALDGQAAALLQRQSRSMELDSTVSAKVCCLPVAVCFTWDIMRPLGPEQMRQQASHQVTKLPSNDAHVSVRSTPFDIFKCVAITIGETLLQVVPPFSILTQLGSMLSEFLAFFAELASAAITAAVGETTSLVQEAVSLRSFPGKGEAAKLVSSRDMAGREEPDDTMATGAMGIATTEAMPYATMLISQFGGDEFDTGSCLGFAPAHRTGPGNTVTQRDWQVPRQYGLREARALGRSLRQPMGQGQILPARSVIEKCVAISYTMSAQPVLAFVGGLEFDSRT